ncbi:MAG: hypothetical protein ACR2QO_11215 [Acidimicrobiales bacterium]
MISGRWVLDSSTVEYYWEHPYYPQYLVSLDDVVGEAIPTDALKTVDGARADQRLVEWDKIDHWFEEDEEVFVHPRSP